MTNKITCAHRRFLHGLIYLIGLLIFVAGGFISLLARDSMILRSLARIEY